MQITSQDALLVIDVQKDFCAGGALPVSGGEDVIPIIHRVASNFQHVILTQDWHPSGHISFASAHPERKPFDRIEIGAGLETLWPDHCVQGTPGADFHPDLHLAKAELILRKGFRKELDSYSAFFENDRTTSTGLGGYLRDRGIRRIFLAGLAYDYCVGFSAIDARRLDFPTVVIKDACRAIDQANSVTLIEEEFRQSGVEFPQSNELLAG